MGQPADQLADVVPKRLQKAGVAARFRQHPQQLPDGVFALRESPGVDLRLGGDDDLLYPRRVVAKPQRGRARFGEKAIVRGQERLVDPRAPLQMDAARQQPAVGPLRDGAFDGVPDMVLRLGDAVDPRQIHRDHRPADHVAGQGHDLGDLSVFHADQAGALGAGFPHVPPLQVAGEHDVGPFREHLGLVHVAERPVVVSLVDQIGQGARGIVLVAAQAAEPGVQDADVESAGNRRRVGRGEVVGDVALPEALPVQDRAQPLDLEGFGPCGAEDLHVVRETEAAGDPALRVVVAVEQVDGNARGAEAAHLAGEEQAGLVVAPVAVVQVAGDDEERGLFFDGVSDKPLECVARGGADTFGGASLLSGEPLQGAVQMDVSGMKEAKGAHLPDPCGDNR